MERIQESFIVFIEESEEPGIEVRGDQEDLLDFARTLRKHGISYHFNYEKIFGGTFMVAVVAELTKEAAKVLVDWLKKSRDRKRTPHVKTTVHGEPAGLSAVEVSRIRKILREAFGFEKSKQPLDY